MSDKTSEEDDQPWYIKLIAGIVIIGFIFFVMGACNDAVSEPEADSVSQSQEASPEPEETETSPEPKVADKAKPEQPEVEKPVDDIPNREVREIAFIIAINKAVPESKLYPDRALIKTGRDICSTFKENGVSEQNILVYANSFVENLGWTYSQTGALLGAATRSFCPAVNREIAAVLPQ